MKKRVVLLTDRESEIEGDPDLVSRRAKSHSGMEYYVGRALRELGCEVTIAFCRSGRQVVADLTRLAPDVVFNAAEHMYGDPTRDVHVAALLEALRLPYTGGSPATLLLCRDKTVTKSLAAAAGVRVPPFAMLPPGRRNGVPLPPFPLVVKPSSRDSSVGIGVASFVRTPRALATRIGVVHRRFRDTALVESFIPGVDVNVYVVEGKRLQIGAPTSRRVSAADPSSPHSMATYHVKHNAAYRDRWQIRYEPAHLSRATLRAMHHDIHTLWPILKLRDYARFDYRLTESGDLYFIEANTNPGFSLASRSERWTWEGYRKAVKTVISNALRRGA